MEILQKMFDNFNDSLPFAVYGKPDSRQLTGIFQQTRILHFVEDFSASGFVFAPFYGSQIVLIPEGESVILIEDRTRIPSNMDIPFDGNRTDENDQSTYENLVGEALSAIRSGNFDKVVLSRSESVDIPHFDLIATFERLLNQYPSAFAYCFFHPEIGLWLGAFSEQLLQIESNHFHTMSVAGTQPFREHAEWGNKEKAEQQFVTDFIVHALQDKASELTISNPYTLKAGNLMHIKTDVAGTLNSDFGLKEMIETLHPTPAVCGFPKEAALEFILNNEGHDRKYYSGFLGEFNRDFSNNSAATDLYVNLRCFEIKADKAILYIGGGVTKDSIPEKEWQETVSKTHTMKQILKTA